LYEAEVARREFRYGDPGMKCGERSMAVDPICKMNVSENQAKYTSIHNGTKYYFCSAACKQEFEKDPTKYTK
jgi:YHS domain-containing protein